MSLRTVLAAMLVSAGLAACGGGRVAAPDPASAPQTKSGGGYYLDDGPGDHPPANLDAIPDAMPVVEPPHRFANRPYAVLGRNYVPLPADSVYLETGIASWYGRKFHGQPTSSGEPYDMYAMTAAHPTLPIPSYARVTNPANGRSVVVRVNDRGPFHADRLIDLSYAAAHKLGFIGSGSTRVNVELLHPGGTQVSAARESLPLSRAVAARIGSEPLPQQRDAGGTWLQLGAFGNRENARAFFGRMQAALAGSGYEQRLDLRADAALHRVRIGPFATSDGARAAGVELERRLGMPSVIVPERASP